MAPITPQEQEQLNKQYQNLNGWEKAELVLSSMIGMKFPEKDLETIKTAVTEYISWHEKQHPSFETCDHCEFVKDNIAMFKVIKFWSDHFQEMKKHK
jgi:hypothetical protein